MDWLSLDNKTRGMLHWIHLTGAWMWRSWKMHLALAQRPLLWTGRYFFLHLWYMRSLYFLVFCLPYAASSIFSMKSMVPRYLLQPVTSCCCCCCCCSPHNPTGKVFSHYELGAIAALCCKYDCLAITDEVQPSFSSTLLFTWIKKKFHFFPWTSVSFCGHWFESPDFSITKLLCW